MIVYPQDWLVWALPIITAPLVPVLGRLNNRLREYSSVLVSATAAILSLSLLTGPLPRESSFPWLAGYNFMVQVRVDGLSTFLAILVNALGLAILVYSTGYMHKEKGLDRYYSLVLLFIGAMTGLVLSGNFVQLYIFWETVGICSSFLISFWYDRPNAVKAGLKAFVVTRVGDIGLLAGFVYLWSHTGTVNFAALEQLAGHAAIPVGVLTVGGLLVFLGAMGKSAQFPLQVWLPDAMEGPSTVSALIHAATMVNAGVFLVARTLPIFSYSTMWLAAVGTVGIGSAVLAAPLAMAAADLKRVLAYSTISQLGLMFASLGLGTGPGLFASQLHLMSQGAFKALGFLSAGAVIHSLGYNDMNRMGGLRRRMPITFIAFTCSVLAMSGVPPFIGFWSKDAILAATVTSGNSILSILVLSVGVMTSFYAFRALFKVFIVQPRPENMSEVAEAHEAPMTMTIPLIALSGAVLVLFLFQGMIAQLLGTTVESLDFTTALMSVGAAVIGFLPAYSYYGRSTQHVWGASWLPRVEQVLLAGYGFDKLYDTIIVRPAQYAAAKVRNLQTGVLGVNLWAVLVFLVIVLVVLIAW